MKDDNEVVKEFNEIVNMTADELEKFLETGDSENTGWSKGDGSGESVGHESGRKIVDILKRNPNKDSSKYTDEDKQHMRKVVSYCKRHLAQEEHMKQEKSPEELEKTKSTRSLKNWGHDPLKTMKGGKGNGNSASASEKPKSSSKKDEKPKSSGKPASKKDKAEKPKSAGKKEEKEVEDKTETGDKRAANKVEEGEGEKKATEKPASKKAKTTKEPTEGTRKPPSRGAKKA